MNLHPDDWFDLFPPKNRIRNTYPIAVTLEDLNAWTNTKAMVLNTGSRGGKYSCFVDFNTHEIMPHISISLSSVWGLFVPTD